MTKTRKVLLQHAREITVAIATKLIHFTKMTMAINCQLDPNALFQQMFTAEASLLNGINTLIQILTKNRKIN